MLRGYILFAMMMVVLKATAADDATSGLWKGFSNPQDSARTKVWWFHGQTETTREGITADLEAFKRQGVGGVVFYNQVHGKQTSGALKVFSPEWWQMFVFAAQEAKRLGLTFETHISDGYVAGGPWITPDLGMQRLTSEELRVTNYELNGLIPNPSPKGEGSGNNSILRSSGVQECRSEDNGLSRNSSILQSFNSSRVDELQRVILQSFNSSSFLLAYPLKGKEWERSKTISEGKLMTIEADGNEHYLDFDISGSFTARRITYRCGKRGKATTSATNVPGPPGEIFVGTGYREMPDIGELQASDDGKNYFTVCRLKNVYNAHGSWNQKTIAFPAVRACHFRLRLHDWNPEGEKRNLRIGDISLHSAAGVNEWEEKAALYSEYIERQEIVDYPDEECLRSDEMIDLKQFVDADGHLQWKAPEGDWLIMRFAPVPTGAKTKHGTEGMGGLECDKLSARAAEVQWRNYFKVMSDTLARYGLAIDGLAMDSHEAGSQNWTADFEKQFERRRGYSLLPYLPVMMGYVVDSAERSEQVLQDVRRTIADLIADEYYATLDSLCHSVGIPFTAQATGNALCIVSDPIQAKGRVAKPQGEFWAIHPDGNYDIKECSSAAHLYGKPIASGEAFTDVKFTQPLSYIKSLADYAYCYGINEFVVCASAYQAQQDKMPYNTGGGRHYCLNRNNTYWPFSQPFWDYQARCSWMMRQGKPVVDLCVYLGDNAPVKILTYRLPVIPSGFYYDAFTADALYNRMRAEDGRIVLPDGLSYRAMIIPRRTVLTPQAAARIDSFERAGVPIIRETTLESVAEGIRNHGLLPSIRLQHGDMNDLQLWFAHRATEDAELYFLNNHGEELIDDALVISSPYRNAEWWNPVDNKRTRLTQTTDGAWRIHLQPKEAGFVVLSNQSVAELPSYDRGKERMVKTISDDWNVCFDKSMGGVGDIHFPQLTDWTNHTDTAIRYFSGTAIYEKKFKIKKPKARTLLRIPQLHDIAKVEVNGIDAGIIWCSPWQLDITRLLRKGKNTLRISVANTLMNRMILDSSFPQEQRVTEAIPVIAKPDDPLMPSGIVGSVELLEVE